MTEQSQGLEHEENSPVEPQVDKRVEFSKRVSETFSDYEIAMLESGDFPDNVEDFEDWLIDDGADLTSVKFQKELNDRLAPTREKIEAARSTQRQRPDWYTRVKNIALTSRDGVALLYVLMFMAVVPFFTMMALFISETFSAGLGIRTFLHGGFEDVVAWILSITLTMMYFSLEWRYTMLLAKHGTPAVYQFTVAIWWDKLRYVFNRNAELKLKQDNHGLVQAKRIARWTMISLVLLGVLGRLGDEFQTLEEGVWHVQIVNIVTQSDLPEFLEYMGGGLLAFILLLGTRFVISGVYEIWLDIGGQDESFFDSSSMQEELRRVHLRFLQRYAKSRWDSKKSGKIKKYEALKAEVFTPVVDTPLEMPEPEAQDTKLDTSNQ